MYVKTTTVTETYELWRKRSQDLRTNIEAKVLLGQKHILNKGTTNIVIDDIKENIRSHMQDNIEQWYSTFFPPVPLETLFHSTLYPQSC
jgi:hypothetical protein